MRERKTESRKAYVVYEPTLGFVKNRNGDFTKEFTHARLYGQPRDAEFSITQHKDINSETAHVIPVDMILDPKQIFTAVLKGAQGKL